MIEVPLAVKENEYDWLDSLTDMGFLIEEFGQNSYIIREIPTFMTISEAESFAKEFVDSLTAVSYTHLDVYKRQTLCYDLGLFWFFDKNTQMSRICQYPKLEESFHGFAVKESLTNAVKRIIVINSEGS